MRSLEASRERWQVTRKHDSSLDELKRAVRADGDNSPCVSGLRSVCWKAFLLFQSTEVTGWRSTLTDSRSAYTSLREHLLRYIENPDEVSSALDPLADDKNSPWNTLRQDEEIRAEIYQDVERCMPEEDYFRRPETQRMLLDILFVFCKINQDVGYRQGMHEILAPILWVVDQDAIDRQSLEQSADPENDQLLKEILDSAYIEHDAFTLLSLVMRSAKSFYELGEPDKKPNSSPVAPGAAQQGVSPIVERSKRIHEVYLARLDPDLATHLTKIEILPQIFLIRWIRLIFGREFPFDELLALWDVLLAEDPELDLVDMVCVAMLLRIRWQLIEANYSMALMLLLKYPSPPQPYGPQTFVDDAIYLRDNFSAVGGAKIISKYGEKPPPMSSTSSRPTTPLGQSLNPKQRLLRTRSPMSTPAKFLQQQGGVEALFQGAAKGVLERGEKLGINRAVRDAMGEVRKNMQGLQVSRSNSPRSGASDGMRWSLDEGKSIPSSKASMITMNKRNQQLARMLHQAMSDLRAVSVSKESSKETCTEAMDLAIAKVDFVKVYLEDVTMPLPPESPLLAPAIEPHDPPKALLQDSLLEAPHLPAGKSEPTENLVAVEIATPISDSQKPIPELPVSRTLSPSLLARTENRTPPIPKDKPIQDLQKDKDEALSSAGLFARPRAPVPTRSTIAQSSFSWMLEPGASSHSPLNSSPPKSSSPFLKTGRKPTSGPGREKAAFLFGEEEGESSMVGSRLPLGDIEEGFHMGIIGGSDDKVN